MDTAYIEFLSAYPEYANSLAVDSLRDVDFSRLARSGETYLDYMGGSLYPESLLRDHYEFLSRSVMALPFRCTAHPRPALLAPVGYTVISTANATAALKLVGESYPSRSGGTFVLPVDCHNSVNGIRTFASRGGAKVCYLKSSRVGGIDISDAQQTLYLNRPFDPKQTPCLFAITGLSNISNAKTPLDIARFAQAFGYHALLNAAALAPSSRISLRQTPVDAMAVSFYKMFGYPTGVGALVVRESFLKELKRPWFAGGTVDVVQVPGSLVTVAPDVREQFEDGTINYLSLPAITSGLRFLSPYLQVLPDRLSSLHHYLISELRKLRHDVSDAPVVEILSRVPLGIPSRSEGGTDTGFLVSLIFRGPDGLMIPHSFIEYAAARSNISLRTGCVCNPGGAAAILGIEDDMNRLEPGVTLKDFQLKVGRELGVVRISLGLVSSFADVQQFVRFAASIGTEETRHILWTEWARSPLNET